MAIDNTHNSYGWMARLLHWTMAVLIIGLLGVGLYMEGLPNTPWKYEVYGLHKSTGLLVLALIIFRITWRSVCKVPRLPVGMATYEKFLARLTHACLYLLMLIMPLSGWIMSSGRPISFYGLFNVPDVFTVGKSLRSVAHDIHVNLVWVFIALICLHIAAALYHHFIRKDNVLIGMLTGKERQLP